MSQTMGSVRNLMAGASFADRSQLHVPSERKPGGEAETLAERPALSSPPRKVKRAQLDNNEKQEETQRRVPFLFALRPCTVALFLPQHVEQPISPNKPFRKPPHSSYRKPGP